MAILSTWTRGDAAILPLVVTCIPASLLAGLWLGAAWGWGTPLRRWLAPDGCARSEAGMQLTLGVATLLWLNMILGSLGWLTALGGAPAWALVIVGGAMALVGLTRKPLSKNRKPLAGGAAIGAAPPGAATLRTSQSTLSSWWLLPLVPAVAVLLVAACSAPGWLWATEFGGYDALSYHLQLPKEWLALGRIQPLEHNVYSFLPSYVEGAYLHLMVLTGDPFDAAYACQMLHALVAIGAGLLVVGVTRQLLNSPADHEASTNPSTRDSEPGAGNPPSPHPSNLGPRCFPLASAILLGVPWVVVVGSLAYNEMFVVLLLAGAMSVTLRHDLCSRRRGLAVGLALGAACGAKLTAAGLAVAPMAAFVLFHLPSRRWLAFALLAAAGGLIALAPYLIRNALHAGNPVFPFLTSVFGSAHWTAEQAEAWRRGHFSDVGLSGRIAALWNQFPGFGFGDPPAGSADPWKPQWSFFPLLLVGGFAVCLWRADARRAAGSLGAMILVQIGFWLLFTHLKSRFLLPVVAPGSVLAALGVASVLRGRWLTRNASLAHDDGTRPQRAPRPFVTVACGLLALVWCVGPVFIFASEKEGAPSAFLGAARLYTGDAFTDAERRALADQLPAIVVNHLLPGGSRTLLVGESAPFYYNANVAYATTWDRGPMSSAARDPAGWAIAFASLRRQGFTHVLINAGMLDRWRKSGWGDPMLDPDALVEAAEEHADLVSTFERGAVRLYRLR